MRDRIVIFALICSTLTAVFCTHETEGLFAAGARELASSPPESQGMNRDAVDSTVRKASEIEDLCSLIIMRNGYIVAEHYASGYDRNSVFNVKSVCKSVVSSLVGIAMKEGLIPSLDKKIIEIFPEYADDVSAQKKNITVRHLLTHTSGVQWIENGPVVSEWVSSPDWVGFFFMLPQSAEPGAQFNYSTAGTHVLSAMITRVTGMNALEYGNERLFGPAGIRIERWDEDPRGNSFGGAELFCTARDMACFGLLYQNNGTLDGVSLVPAEWVAESSRIQVDVGGDPEKEGYGYQWWVRRDMGIDVYYASGYGGQFIFIVPERGLVVVITSSLSNSTDQARLRKNTIDVLNLLYRDIVPAAE